jgi:hypothetical protein
VGEPNTGGHVGPNWFIQYGMDLGGVDTAVYASFDAHVTKYQAHDPASDTSAVYGAQIFARSPSDKMGGFYTHITNVPSSIGPGTAISRGDFLGNILPHGLSPHLHVALVEIIGGAPGGQYVGVDSVQPVPRFGDN